MVIRNKTMLIEKLTGVHSSKKSYYVELKKKMRETSKRNIQLEIINQLAKSIGIDMSFKEIIEDVTPKLRVLFNFDTLSLYVVEKEKQVTQVVLVTNFDHESAITTRSCQDEDEGEAIIGEDLKEVIRQKKPVYRYAAAEHPGAAAPAESAEPAAAGGRTAELPVVEVMVPLLAKNKVIGVLEVYSREGIKKGDLPFFEQVADQLAVCLENVRLYNELLQSKRELEITFSAVTDLLVFIDRNCAVQRVNKAAMDFFVMGEDEILGQKCYRLFYGRESKCNPCLADQVMRTQKTSYLQSRTRYNRVLDIFAYPAYIDHKEPYGVTYYAKDVTSFVDSIKFVSLGEMSAGVAHELNSPLTAIVGDSQLLLRETSPEDPHYQLIKDIHSSGLRCQKIIQNLLTFSRQDEYTFEEVDLNKVVKSALSLVSYQIEKNKINLRVNLSPGMPKLLGSAHGLEQIIVNLLLNAKDAILGKEIDSGNGAAGEIVLQTRLHPNEQLAIIEVTDNGCGIAPEHIPNIFNPFYTTKKIGKGTGLGLSVSLGIAQSHGGFIDLDSTVGKGSTFRVVLPLDGKQEAGQKED
ncbi:MAG: GAF domain-containing protein [Firmicutes bacterium]|nr:GAF domain-containing protein [Bacillota bacterium]